MIDLLAGAIAFASLMVGLIFLRFWRNTHDRFFIYFALSFWIEGLNRLISGITHSWYEDTPERYLVRLVSYGLIVLAIWEKNRSPLQK
ncbi:MAG: DUF5985 family protein [Spongiibacteraceae bacterium]